MDRCSKWGDGRLPSQYMPLLLALVEAMQARYGVEHGSNSPGPETLFSERPIIKVEFNYEQGVLRDGYKT
jgi:hypothetical protein